MKSKAHYKKCVELGLNPLLSAVDENYNPEDDAEDSSIASSCGEPNSNMADGEDVSDSDEMSDGDDNDNDNDNDGSGKYFNLVVHLKRLKLFTKIYDLNRY